MVNHSAEGVRKAPTKIQKTKSIKKKKNSRKSVKEEPEISIPPSLIEIEKGVDVESRKNWLKENSEMKTEKLENSKSKGIVSRKDSNSKNFGTSENVLEETEVAKKREKITAIKRQIEMNKKGSGDKSHKSNFERKTMIKEMRSSDKSLPQASRNQKWNPIQAASRYLYDATNGVPLSREEQAKNIKTAWKSKMDVDPDDFLQLASKFHGKNEDCEQLALGCSWISVMLNNKNRLQNCSGDETVRELKFTFNECEAKKWPGYLETPSCIKIHFDEKTFQDFVKHATNRPMDTCVRNITRIIVDLIEVNDEYYMCYASPKSYTCRNYIPLGVTFIDEITKFLMMSLEIESLVENTAQTRNRIKACVQTSLDNTLQKKRQAFDSKDPPQSSLQRAMDLRECIRELQNELFMDEPSTSGSGIQERLSFLEASPVMSDSDEDNDEES